MMLILAVLIEVRLCHESVVVIVASRIGINANGPSTWLNLPICSARTIAEVLLC